MKVIEGSTEIARSPGEVFDYITDAARLPEWQPSVKEAGAEPPAIRQVGMRGYEVRRVPGGPQKIRWAVIEECCAHKGGEPHATTWARGGYRNDVATLCDRCDRLIGTLQELVA